MERRRSRQLFQVDLVRGKVMVRQRSSGIEPWRIMKKLGIGKVGNGRGTQ